MILLITHTLDRTGPPGRCIGCGEHTNWIYFHYYYCRRCQSIIHGRKNLRMVKHPDPKTGKPVEVAERGSGVLHVCQTSGVGFNCAQCPMDEKANSCPAGNVPFAWGFDGSGAPQADRLLAFRPSDRKAMAAQWGIPLPKSICDCNRCGLGRAQ